MEHLPSVAARRAVPLQLQTSIVQLIVDSTLERYVIRKYCWVALLNPTYVTLIINIENIYKNS